MKLFCFIVFDKINDIIAVSSIALSVTSITGHPTFLLMIQSILIPL